MRMIDIPAFGRRRKIISGCDDVSELPPDFEPVISPKTELEKDLDRAKLQGNTERVRQIEQLLGR